MSVLIETTLGDIVIDLDLEGSPTLCKNFLKLVKSEFYSRTLVYDVEPNRFCLLGDPRGDGTGGSSIYGLIASTLDPSITLQSNPHRFLRSDKGCRVLSEEEQQTPGIVSMIELGDVEHTIGSQFLINLPGREGMFRKYKRALSLGVVAEDEANVLERTNELYCDRDGRPFVDVRIVRASVLDDPYEDPKDMDALLKSVKDRDSPPVRPAEEIVEIRIGAETLASSNPIDEEEIEEKDAKSRAVVLEMLGDLPSAEITAPDTVLFICKLNPVTQDQDLTLIFSRFDQDCKAEVVRDMQSGESLCYAFVEFNSKEACAEAYFKMNNALVDDRRIKVDFSQSVSKEWDRFRQIKRGGGGGGGHNRRDDRGPPTLKTANAYDRGRDEYRESRFGKSYHPKIDKNPPPPTYGRSDNRHQTTSRNQHTSRHGENNRSPRASRDNASTGSDSYHRRRRRERKHEKRSSRSGRHDRHRDEDGKKRKSTNDDKDRKSSRRHRHRRSRRSRS